MISVKKRSLILLTQNIYFNAFPHSKNKIYSPRVFVKYFYKEERFLVAFLIEFKGKNLLQNATLLILLPCVVQQNLA